VSGFWPRLLPMGDRGLLIEYPREISPEINALVRGADAALAGLPGVVETVPAFRSVLAVYDPMVVGFDDLAERVEAAVRAAKPAPAEGGALLEVPVVYGGVHGPDLEAVAAACGLSPADVIRLHTATTYRVYMLGFSPGFPYLGLLPSELRVPRRATPRTRIPTGSIAIADLFAGVYPQETPGGWHLLGRTPLRLFDPHGDPPCLLQPGDRVRFVRANGEPASESPPLRPMAMPRRPVLEVIRPGLMTSIQDLGRRGGRRLGVAGSGAMDVRALRAANGVLGNHPGDAAIELTFPGPSVRALADAEIAIAGANFEARLNTSPIEPLTATRLRPGDVISFQAPRRGQWLYLALAGGVDVPPVFDSRSTYARGGLGGIDGRVLRAGDILGAGEPSRARRAQHPADAVSPAGPMRVIVGPQAEYFTAGAQAALLGLPFELTVQRDRSGMRLRGPRLEHRGSAEILSDGLLPGSIQVPADGGPVIILADGPTTGGYPKIASVITADLDRLAQCGPGERLRFEAVTVAAAHALLRERVAEQAVPR
jgi:KipI family sensor histidine kinase inhibitor